jgi:Fur family ferric uptake transcriptional regulator
MLDILEQSNQPIAAEDLFLELKKGDISANLSTVYRTLEILVENSLATKLIISSDNRALFEINRMVHRHYLICLGCKKIIPIDYCPLEDYEKSLAKETNYEIAGHKLDIYGYCPVCRLKNRR